VETLGRGTAGGRDPDRAAPGAECHQVRTGRTRDRGGRKKIELDRPGTGPGLNEHQEPAPGASARVLLQELHLIDPGTRTRTEQKAEPDSQRQRQKERDAHRHPARTRDGNHAETGSNLDNTV